MHSESRDHRSGTWLPAHHDPLTWFVAYTKPRQEAVAQVNAERQGFHTYLPMYRVVKGQALPASQQAENHEPMFPRYLFVKPSRTEQSLATLRSTRGITSMVAFGDELATVSDNSLEAIRRYEDWRNHAQPHLISTIQPGQHVRIKDTGLHGLEGLVQTVSSRRVIVLLNLLGRHKAVKVRHEQLEPA